MKLDDVERGGRDRRCVLRCGWGVGVLEGRGGEGKRCSWRLGLGDGGGANEEGLEMGDGGGGKGGRKEGGLGMEAGMEVARECARWWVGFLVQLRGCGDRELVSRFFDGMKMGWERDEEMG